MKNQILIILIFIAASSCGEKEEVMFEAFSPEAFAYDLGDSWEVNSSVNVRGFNKLEAEDEKTASLSFTVDVTNPDDKVLEDVFTDSKEETEKELSYIQLEAQFELDKSYALGKYKITFRITDKYSGKTTLAETVFELKE